MRPIVLGLLAATSLVSATGGVCLQSDLENFVSKSSCGCAGHLAKCLEAVVDSKQLDQAQLCFAESGCTVAETVRGAAWYAEDCHAGKGIGPQGELRKRQKKTQTTTSELVTTSSDEQSSSQTTQATAVTPSSSSPASTDASTTATASDSSSSTDSASSSTPSTTTSAASTTSASSQSTTTGSTTTSLVCSVMTTYTTTACSYSSMNNRYSKLGCGVMVTSTPTCAPGIICQTDTQGNPVCLLRSDKLTTSGTVVTIAFSVGVVAVAIAIFVMSMRTRAANKRAGLERAALLGGGGKGKAMEMPYGQHQNPSEANVPLMSPSGTRHEHAYPYMQESHGSQNDVSAPRLHPGLGALGQDHTYR